MGKTLSYLIDDAKNELANGSVGEGVSVLSVVLQGLDEKIKNGSILKDTKWAGLVERMANRLAEGKLSVLRNMLGEYAISIRNAAELEASDRLKLEAFLTLSAALVRQQEYGDRQFLASEVAF